eukprot:6344634-Heterocapsa_arctica.AAC.1
MAPFSIQAVACEKPSSKLVKSVGEARVVDQVGAELVQADVSIVVAIGELERVRPNRTRSPSLACPRPMYVDASSW